MILKKINLRNHVFSTMSVKYFQVHHYRILPLNTAVGFLFTIYASGISHNERQMLQMLSCAPTPELAAIPSTYFRLIFNHE